MGTTTELQLDTMLLQSIGPHYIRHPVTTAINADALVVSTHLTNYRNTVDYFNDWWIFFDDQANEGVSRQILDDDGSNTLTVRGAVLSDDGANLANFRLSPYSWEQRTRAIIEAIDEIYPHLYRELDIMALVTGNVLPNSHFENWAVSTFPDKYTVTNAAAVQETTAGLIRGAKSSAKVTASAGNGYMSISSDDYPRLLDLMGQTVDFKCWASPEEADDATIQIITTQADGTTQTLSSTTAAPAAAFTALVLENQVLNSDLVTVEIRFRVTTNGKFVYFDDARLFGQNRFEYLLPTDFDSGSLAEVWIQTRGALRDATNTDASDELQVRHWERIWGWQIMEDGTDRHLRLPALFTQQRRVRLIGTGTLEALSQDTPDGTISLDGRRLNLLIAFAKYKLYTIVPGIPASEDISGYDSAAAKALFDYRRLHYLSMAQKSRNMKIRPIVEDSMIVRVRGRGRF